MEEDNLMVYWKEIVVIVDAHMIEFAWEISLEIRIRIIIEAMEISGLRMKTKEREKVAMKLDIQ